MFGMLRTISRIHTRGICIGVVVGIGVLTIVIGTRVLRVVCVALTVVVVTLAYFAAFIILVTVSGVISVVIVLVLSIGTTRLTWIIVPARIIILLVVRIVWLLPCRVVGFGVFICVVLLTRHAGSECLLSTVSEHSDSN